MKIKILLFSIANIQKNLALLRQQPSELDEKEPIEEEEKEPIEPEKNEALEVEAAVAEHKEAAIPTDKLKEQGVRKAEESAEMKLKKQTKEVRIINEMKSMLGSDTEFMKKIDGGLARIDKMLASKNLTVEERKDLTEIRKSYVTLQVIMQTRISKYKEAIGNSNPDNANPNLFAEQFKGENFSKLISALTTINENSGHLIQISKKFPDLYKIHENFGIDYNRNLYGMQNTSLFGPMASKELFIIGEKLKNLAGITKDESLVSLSTLRDIQNNLSEMDKPPSTPFSGKSREQVQKLATIIAPLSLGYGISIRDNELKEIEKTMNFLSKDKNNDNCSLKSGDLTISYKDNKLNIKDNKTGYSIIYAQGSFTAKKEGIDDWDAEKNNPERLKRQKDANFRGIQRQIESIGTSDLVIGGTENENKVDENELKTFKEISHLAKYISSSNELKSNPKSKSAQEFMKTVDEAQINKEKNNIHEEFKKLVKENKIKAAKGYPKELIEKLDKMPTGDVSNEDLAKILTLVKDGLYNKGFERVNDNMNNFVSKIDVNMQKQLIQEMYNQLPGVTPNNFTNPTDEQIKSMLQELAKYYPPQANTDVISVAGYIQRKPESEVPKIDIQNDYRGAMRAIIKERLVFFSDSTTIINAHSTLKGSLTASSELYKPELTLINGRPVITASIDNMKVLQNQKEIKDQPARITTTRDPITGKANEEFNIALKT